MLEAYITTIEKPRSDDSELKFLFSTLKYDFFSDRLLLIDRSVGFKNEPLLNSCKEFLSMFLAFPGRALNNIKLKYGDRYIILSGYLNKIDSEWYGVSILHCDKEFLPLKQEKEFICSIYELIGPYADKYFELENWINNYKTKFKREPLVITNYKNLNRERDDIKLKLDNLCVLQYNTRSEKRFLNNLNKNPTQLLEETIMPKKDSNTEWDIFLMRPNGTPATRVLQYSNKSFTEPNDEKVFTIQGKKMTHLELYTLNIAGIGALYGVSKKISELLKINDLSLRHLSSKLHDNKGYSFTLIDELPVEDNKLLLVIDIRNRLVKGEPYINKLFGNERETLSKIKEALKDNPAVNQAYNESCNGAYTCESTPFIFDVIKEVIKKNAII